MDAVRGAADKAVYRRTYEGTNTGPGGTGKRVRFNAGRAWTFSDEGLIAESIGSFDSEEYERQLAEGARAGSCNSPSDSQSERKPGGRQGT